MIEMIKKNKVGVGNRGDHDVLFSVTKHNGGKAHQMGLTFTKDAKKRVFKDCNYGAFGFNKNPNCERLYFLPSNSKDGFKLSQRSESDNCVMRTTIDNRFRGVIASNWVGYYDIQFDANENMWYIELQQKKVEVK